jgi:hypothetical protein
MRSRGNRAKKYTKFHRQGNFFRIDKTVFECDQDILLEDRAALASEDAEVVRKISLRRRAVEETTRVAGRLQVALTEGVDIVVKILQPQLQKVEGISEEEMKLIKVRGTGAGKKNNKEPEPEKSDS